MCPGKLYELRTVPNYPGDELTVVHCLLICKLTLQSRGVSAALYQRLTRVVWVALQEIILEMSLLHRLV